jgi:hypothetical protein
MAGIHTLNARGNLLLPVLREHFAWTDARTFQEIQRLHGDLLDILRAKGIDYASLRSALTPQSTKHEAAFLFDEQRCADMLVPGAECADALFRALDRKSTHCVFRRSRASVPIDVGPAFRSKPAGGNAGVELSDIRGAAVNDLWHASGVKT